MVVVVWLDLAVVVLLAAGIYAFIELAGFRTRMLTRRTTRTAESMYDSYADSARKQRKQREQQGGQQ
jgi:hypothetical protein